MNNNYIKLNNLGLLVDSELHEVSQGNHNVDYYYIAYDVYDYTNGFVDVYVTLPDGTKMPPLPTIPCDFEFKGNNYKGFLFKLKNTLTSISGVLTMTFGLISNDNNTELCSTQLKIDIHESDTPSEATITNLQFEQMQEAIRENYLMADEALSKANDALYHDATIVKINGEVQQTWDATAVSNITTKQAEFLKEEYDKSYNLFDKNAVIKGYALAGNTGELIKTENRYTSDYINVKGLNYVYVSGNKTIGSDNAFYDKEFKYLSYYSQKVGVVPIPNNAVYMRINGALDELDKDIMVTKGDKQLPYQPYNSASHITNSETEFLKEEYNKQLNLFNINNKYFRTSDNGYNIAHLDVVPSVIDYSIVGNRKIVINSYNNTGYRWLATTVKLEKNKDYYINVKSTNAFALMGVNSLNVGETGTHIRNSNGKFNSGNYNYYVISFYPGGNNVSFEDIIISKYEADWQPFNGKTLHPIDITPIKVWENASPNTGFDRLKADFTAKLNDKPYFYIECKTSGTSGVGTRLLKYRSGATTYTCDMTLSMGACRRNVENYNTSMWIYECKMVDTQYNDYVIPVAIYSGDY